MPLDRLGITDSDEVLSVHTSCECTRPSVLYFLKSDGQTARALRIDFTVDKNTADLANSKAAPSNLAVEVTFHFGDGHAASATIQFLLTTRLQGAGSSS